MSSLAPYLLLVDSTHTTHTPHTRHTHATHTPHTRHTHTPHTQVAITPGASSSSFQYQLFIDGEPIERELAISAPGLSADMGSHFVQMRRSPNGFGMTLANCGMRDDGVVVIELEAGLPAHRAGLLVGDVILSVDDVTTIDTRLVLEILARAERGVSPVPSTKIHLPKSLPCSRCERAPNGGGGVLSPTRRKPTRGQHET